MQSLDSLLRHHPSLLILDAASASVQAGWIERGANPRWVSIAAEASAGVFAAINELEVSPNAATAFVFCEGPGSILGIRTVATAIRMWTALRPRPVYSYRSLELIARTHGRPGQIAICDARRQSWHATAIDANHAIGPLTRIPTAELPRSGLITPAGFRQWSAAPAPAPTVVAYEPDRLTTDLSDFPLLRDAPEPDAFLHENPSYVQWTPAVHRGPPPSP